VVRASPRGGRNDDRHFPVCLWGARANGRLQVENIENAIVGNLAPRFRDLLEIAAYVYLADTEVTRGAETDVFGTDWRRRFRFVVPVVDTEFWTDTAVRERMPG
jgi:hypothetical protein